MVVNLLVSSYNNSSLIDVSILSVGMSNVFQFNHLDILYQGSSEQTWNY
jgi:hypothetical protein